MSRVWARANIACRCGYCRARIEKGAVHQVILPWKKRRCETCADGPVPTELPAPLPPRALRPPTVPITSEPTVREIARRFAERLDARAARDWKAAQAKDDR